MIKLTEKQRRHLRGLAHERHVIVQIGNAGLSEGVSKELDSALGAHELVKVRARLADRDLRNSVLEELAKKTTSALVQRIGNVGVFYRPHQDKPRIILPGD